MVLQINLLSCFVEVKKFQYGSMGRYRKHCLPNGEVGRFIISQATYDLIKNDKDFKFKSRRKTQVKGIGEMEMYFAENGE